MDFFYVVDGIINSDFFHHLSWQILLALWLVSVLAGFIDSIAGGGGLLTVPALLIAGIPPNLALATNKMQGWGSSGIAALYFIRKGLINLHECKFMVFTTFVGSAFGGWLLFYLPTDYLKIVIPILLIMVGLYFLFKPELGALENKRKISPVVFSLCVASVIGWYDGFFGPGTGTFLVIAFVYLAGYQLTKATAHAKILNFTSNIAAMSYFILFEEVIWGVGLVMLTGQILGGSIGARLVFAKGIRIIRPILVGVCFIIAGKLIYDQLY